MLYNYDLRDVKKYIIVTILYSTLIHFVCLFVEMCCEVVLYHPENDVDGIKKINGQI